MYKQQISRYGSRHIVVARTFFQGAEIVDDMALPEDDASSLKQHLWDLQTHMIRCQESRDSIANQVEAGRDSFRQTFDQEGNANRVTSIPGVLELQGSVDSFLHAAKLSVADAGNLLHVEVGRRLGHKFHQLSKACEDQLGPDSEIAQSVRRWEPFVKRLVKMRNCIDHPLTEPGAPLVVENFRLENGGALLDPRWGLTGEQPKPLVPDLDDFIQKCIELSEDVLIGIFNIRKKTGFLQLQDVPVDQRDESNPRRLFVQRRFKSMFDFLNRRG